jgi:hypothetical protein
MPYAILEVSKLTSLAGATAATEHNYRTQDTPNANPELADANVEYINHDRRNYWQLATERIQELQLPRLRTDAVRAVELVLTASPEAFPRAADHRAKDVRDSPWRRDNLAFVLDRFGEKNVLGFTLHQDEITPHIHCVVVPITADGRLSCRDVFSPASLRQLQTDYAQAMAPHGLKRGIRYSTACHEDVRRYYGAQQMSKEALAELAQPLASPTHRLAAKHEKMTDEQYRQQAQSGFTYVLTVLQGKANKKIEELATVATANALAREQAKVLERQLANCQELLIGTRAELSATKTKLQQQQELTTKTQLHHRQAVTRHLQNDPLPEALATLARNQRTKQLREVNHLLAKHLCPPLRELTDLAAPLLAKGYDLKVTGPQEVIITHQREKTRFSTTDLQPNGCPLLEQFQQVVAQPNRQIQPRERDNGIEM